VLFWGLGLLGLSALVLSQAQSYAGLMLGSSIAGLGNAVFHPADFTLLNKRVSPPRLGHAFSVHGITGNLGWAAAPVFLIGLTGLFGWRTALLCAAILPLAVLLLLFLQRELLGNDDLRQAVATTGKDVAPAGKVLDFMKVPAVWMCFGFFLIVSLGLGGIQSFASPGLSSLYGVSLAVATAGFTIYMLASAAGMICGGFIAAKATRHERTIALAFTVSGLTAWVIASGALPAMLAIAMMGLLGFGAGIAGPSRDLLIRAAAPKNALGRVYGTVYSGLDVGMALAPLLFGALMDASRPAWVFAFIGLFQVLAIFTAVGIGSNAQRSAAGAQPA
jgi:MFS family permease